MERMRVSDAFIGGRKFPFKDRLLVRPGTGPAFVDPASPPWKKIRTMGNKS